MREREQIFRELSFRNSRLDPERIRFDLLSSDESAISSALHLVATTCPPKIAVWFLTDFVKHNHTPAATEHACEVVYDAAQAMYKDHDELYEDQIEPARRFFNGLSSMLPAILAEGAGDDFASGLMHAVEYHRDLGQFVGDITSDMLVTRWPSKSVFGLLETIDLPLAAGALRRALQKSNVRSTTFLLDVSLGKLALQLDRRQTPVTDMDKQALWDLFCELSRILPTCIERGHEQYLISGLDDILGSGHDFTQEAKELLEVVAPIRKNRQDVPRFPKMPLLIDFGELKSLTLVFGGLPERRKLQIAKRFSYKQASRKDRIVANALSDIFESESSDRLVMDNEHFVEYIGHASQEDVKLIADIVSLMLDQPKRYRFQTAALLSLLPFDRLPKKLQKKLMPAITSLDMRATLGNENWWLCDSAEELMLKAIYNESVVLVNGAFLVKMIGKMTGICLQTCTSREGVTFVAGNWYSPVDDESRLAIHRAHDAGATAQSVPYSVWALMRPINNAFNKPYHAILDEISRVAAALPEQLSSHIAGKTRRAYRIEEEEG